MVINNKISIGAFLILPESNKCRIEMEILKNRGNYERKACTAKIINFKRVVNVAK